MAFNGALLVGSTLYAYAVAEWEFGLYAAVILGLGLLAWRALRRYSYPWWMLLALQIGVVSHFAGGFVRLPPDSHSLYWHYFAGVRFDRVVHVYNSAIASLALAHVFRSARMRLEPMEGFVVVGTATALGSAIEIIEYFAVRTIPYTGVGDYANTMGDLLMNGLGAIAGYIAASAIVFNLKLRAQTALCQVEIEQHLAKMVGRQSQTS